MVSNREATLLQAQRIVQQLGRSRKKTLTISQQKTLLKAEQLYGAPQYRSQAEAIRQGAGLSGPVVRPETKLRTTNDIGSTGSVAEMLTAEGRDVSRLSGRERLLIERQGIDVARRRVGYEGEEGRTVGISTGGVSYDGVSYPMGSPRATQLVFAGEFQNALSPEQQMVAFTRYKTVGPSVSGDIVKSLELMRSTRKTGDVEYAARKSLSFGSELARKTESSMIGVVSPSYKYFIESGQAKNISVSLKKKEQESFAIRERAFSAILGSRIKFGGVAGRIDQQEEYEDFRENLGGYGKSKGEHAFEIGGQLLKSIYYRTASSFVEKPLSTTLMIGGSAFAFSKVPRVASIAYSLYEGYGIVRTPGIAGKLTRGTESATEVGLFYTGWKFLQAGAKTVTGTRRDITIVELPSTAAGSVRPASRVGISIRQREGFIYSTAELITTRPQPGSKVTPLYLGEVESGVLFPKAYDVIASGSEIRYFPRGLWSRPFTKMKMPAVYEFDTASKAGHLQVVRSERGGPFMDDGVLLISDRPAKLQTTQQFIEAGILKDSSRSRTMVRSRVGYTMILSQVQTFTKVRPDVGMRVGSKYVGEDFGTGTFYGMYRQIQGVTEFKPTELVTYDVPRTSKIGYGTESRLTSFGDYRVLQFGEKYDLDLTFRPQQMMIIDRASYTRIIERTRPSLVRSLGKRGASGIQSSIVQKVTAPATVKPSLNQMVVVPSVIPSGKGLFLSVLPSASLSGGFLPARSAYGTLGIQASPIKQYQSRRAYSVPIYDNYRVSKITSKSVSRTLLLPSVLNVQDSRLISAGDVSFVSASREKSRIGQRTMQSLNLKSYQSSRILSAFNFGNRQVSNRPIGLSIVPTPAPTPPPIGDGDDLLWRRKRSFARGVSGKVRSRYVPSLESLLFSVRGRKRLVAGSIGLRPISV